jgi:hypothetical protein
MSGRTNVQKTCHSTNISFALTVAVAAASIFALCASAQTDYQPSAGNLQARREFQDMKFGMFIHWGVYSVLGDGEWVFHERHLTVDEYNRLPSFFDPEKFDAATWVALAKAAGMKYITITSRHHDGVHHHHLAPSRRIRDVRLQNFRLEYRRAHAL